MKFFQNLKKYENSNIFFSYSLQISPYMNEIAMQEFSCSHWVKNQVEDHLLVCPRTRAHACICVCVRMYMHVYAHMPYALCAHKVDCKHDCNS